MAIVVGQDGYRASKGPGKMNGLKAIKQTALSQRESKAHPKQHNRRNVRQLHGSLRNWMPNICCSSRLRRYNLHWPRQIQLTDESDTCRNQDVDAILMPQSLAIKTPAKTISRWLPGWRASCLHPRDQLLGLDQGQLWNFGLGELTSLVTFFENKLSKFKSPLPFYLRSNINSLNY